VIFNSDQGINKYPAVILAHPKLAQQEIDPDDEEMLALASRPLGIVALKLSGETIEPVLTVDWKKRLDNEFMFDFFSWSVKDEEAPSLE